MPYNTLKLPILDREWFLKVSFMIKLEVWFGVAFSKLDEINLSVSFISTFNQ